MALNPIEPLYSASATATSGSTTITVTGNVNCSFLSKGSIVCLGASQAQAAVSGTAPDISGNSTIVLKRPWPTATITAPLLAFMSYEGLADAVIRLRNIADSQESSLQGGLSFKGSWDASSGVYPDTPSENSGTYVYRVSAPGVVNTINYVADELIYYDVFLSVWRSYYDGLGTASQKDVGTGLEDLPDNTQLNTRLGTSGNLGTVAQRNIGTGSTEVADTAQLNIRLATSGNLGNAATKTVTETITDTTLARLLKVGDFGFAHIENLYTGNLNDAPFGLIAASSSAVNNFFAQNSFALTLSGFPLSVRKRQILYSFGSTLQAERFFDGSVWSSWDLIFSRQNILGTVGQSSGVPTGAIIERGSNANGEYTKFADGTLLCSHITSAAYGPSSSDNGLVYSTNISWTYPAQFSSSPRTFYTPGEIIAQANPICWATGAGKLGSTPAGTTSDTVIYIFFSQMGGFTYKLKCFAIGRWY